jgi:hypothetical protein
MVTLGYLYTTETDALNSRDLLDAHYGCPNNATTHWVTPVQWGEQWAIMYDDTLPVVLGAPVVLPPIPNE